MNKYVYLKVIQGFYAGYWEDLSEYVASSNREARKQIRQDLKEYRFSGDAPIRLISRRELR